MDSTFKRNLFIGYAISMVLLIVSSGASYISIRNLLRSAEDVDHTHEVIKRMNNVLLAVRQGESAQRGYLLTGNDNFLTSYKIGNQEATSSVETLKELTSDNPDQQRDISTLRDLVEQRFAVLQRVIDKKKKTGIVDSADFERGKSYMQQLYTTADIIEEREQALLKQRTDRMNRLSTATPLLIVVAAVLSFIITIISFLRIKTDFENRISLTKTLEKNEREVTKRINIIQEVADKISAGDYAIRVEENSKDVMGNLSISLNKMAGSLENAFHLLSEKEWLQTGIAELNKKMIAEKNLETLTYNALEFITDYTKSGIGAFYFVIDNNLLKMIASIALNKSNMQLTFPIGEGIAGQSALSKKEIVLDNLSDDTVSITFGSGVIKPKAVIAMPVFYEDRLKGVIELNALKSFTPIEIEFLKTAAYNVGIAIHAALDHQRLQALLEETQAQSEELQTQHSELENINSELEAQTAKLQASEEELKVQQEELQQANTELEERSRLLEERNEQIIERNHQIQAKSEALELSTKYKSEFLANMSHELRTPLNSILLLSRLLYENHEKNLTKDQVEYAKVIQGSGNGLLTLIDEILDLSKIESGKMELEYSDVSLENLVNELKAMFLPLANDKKLLFEVNEAADLPKMIETDKLRLEQIIRNLISNALKFTAEGSVKLNITRAAKGISFSVVDTGIGIAKGKQQSIFEAFQQADGSTRRKYGGTGLGLSISRELAKLLGGEITLQSEEGNGSNFTLIIPVEKKILEKEGKSSTPIQYFKSENNTDRLNLHDKKYTTHIIPQAIPDDRDIVAEGDKVILIIEDDVAFGRSLLDFTRKKGYKGIVAVRGDEGVDLANRFLPLGILLDIQLPVKNGWEVMEELKGNAATRLIPVHMMSSHSERSQSIAKGAIDFIDKPVALEKMSVIFKRIEQALSLHPKKVLIVEEDSKHAEALAYYLEGFNVVTQIENKVVEGIEALSRKDVDCVILNLGLANENTYTTLEDVKKAPGLEHVPIIIFTGKNLSHAEEMKLRQFADSIVIKTAHSYQRILDEVSLFLHVVEENNEQAKPVRYKRLGDLSEVLKDKTAVIADDDVRNIFSLTRALENYGMKVLSAIDGKEALKQVEQASKVDIVLMDMMMPEMDGYESIKRIRQIPRFKRLPVIAVTAKAMTGDREKCINAGASDYITKPVDLDQLTSLMRVWLYQGV